MDNALQFMIFTTLVKPNMHVMHICFSVDNQDELEAKLNQLVEEDESQELGRGLRRKTAKRNFGDHLDESSGEVLYSIF